MSAEHYLQKKIRTSGFYRRKCQVKINVGDFLINKRGKVEAIRDDFDTF